MASKKKTKAAPKGAVMVMDPETGELGAERPTALPALTADNKSIVTESGAVITLKKTVNRVVLRHPQGTSVYFTVLSKLRVGKEIKGSTMAPAELVTVREANSGAEMEYIVGAVLKGLWDEEYEKDGYVGKSFAVFKDLKAEGKRHCNISLAEIDVKR